MSVSPAFEDPAFWADDPEPELAGLRERTPVVWCDTGGFWVLTRHADIHAVSRDPERFCSSRGVLISDRGRTVAAADSILYVDPPAHVRVRGLVSRGFTARRVSALEDRVRTLTRGLLDPLDPRRELDLVDAVASPLPLLVIAELLGVPPSDRAQFRLWSDAVIALASQITDANAVLAAELLDYFSAALRERASRPREDLLSVLVTAEVDGERLTQAEQLGFCMTLLVAGNETTRSAIAGGLVALAEHPDQRTQLCRDLTLLPTAVEEVLRWVTPIVAMGRTATADTVIGEEEIAAGDFVVMAYLSANRDPRAFGADADVFDVTRPANPHLTFGTGEHFCLGASLARLETRVVLDELLRRWPAYAVTDSPQRVPSTLVRQLARVPAVLAP